MAGFRIDQNDFPWLKAAFFLDFIGFKIDNADFGCHDHDISGRNQITRRT